MKAKCLNCGTSFDSKYCPNCGQKAETKRLKIVEIISDSISSISGYNNKLRNTLTSLCIRPGHMAREYLLGQRTKYYNPIQLLVWIVAIYALVLYGLGDDALAFDNIKDLNNDDENDTISEMAAYFVSWLKVLYDKKVYFALFQSLLAVFPFWLVFHKTKIQRPDGELIPLNPTEHFYVLTYYACIKMLFVICLLPFSLIPDSEDILNNIRVFVGIIFYIIMYKQLMKLSWYKGVWMSLLAYALMSVLIIVLFVIIIAILVQFHRG